jgi:aminoglycoside 6-adenylyltransferase
MLKNADEKAVIKKITEWAESKPDIRAVLLTSSRAKPDAIIDEFSDYDVILITKDIKPYIEDERWLEEYGKIETIFGFEKFTRVTQYESGLKIDFTLWPVGLLKHVAGIEKLPNYIDDGYKILLDKDGLTRGMKAPSFRAFVPKPPTTAQYLQFVEEFFSNAPYVAKHIQRGDFFPLKSMLDFMRYEKLGKMLEWKAEIEHDWSLKSGNYGKGLVKYLTPEIIRELENTFSSSGENAYWNALFRIINLFRKVAREVGQRLGYAYPQNLDSRVIEYLQKVKKKKLP